MEKKRKEPRAESHIYKKNRQEKKTKKIASNNNWSYSNAAYNSIEINMAANDCTPFIRIY